MPIKNEAPTTLQSWFRSKVSSGAKSLRLVQRSLGEVGSRNSLHLFPNLRSIFSAKGDILVFIFTLILTISSLSSAPLASSDSTDVSSGTYDKVTKELKETEDALNKLVAATKPNQLELKRMQDQIERLKNQVASVEYDLQIKKKEIDNGYKNLAKKQELILHTIRDFYIKSYTESPLSIFLAKTQSSERTQEEVYREIKTNQDRNIITNIALSITSLENKKQQLVKEQKWLITTKASLDEQSAKLDEIVKGALAYQKILSAKIQELSAQQQAIINARSGGFTVNIGDSELADDYNASIKGFRESAPNGYFGTFSFGAYTHRNGMSQYGALGRIKNNSSTTYEQLLKYYYPGISISKIDNGNIIVNGTNSYGQSFNNESYQLEEYLKHIYEVPSSWPAEVLKAQAIAARSYAYGKSTICPGQGCQEFKSEENADSWKQAVKDTEGMIMTGGPGNWQYSSTTGGWINGLGWDTTDGQGGSNFIDKSFEKIAGSPWVYKAWYTETYRNNSDKCGRDNPWLSPEEMADIVNAAIALKTGGIDTSRITPVSSCWGGNPYSMSELRSITPGSINSATSVSVSQNNGNTNSVTINDINFSGDDFKRAFNLRAPGRLSIPQSGFAFFNIEQK
ncbi:hypothetical protein KKE68_04630 [Patescibacteria group bacterium]|nr:hypothetical protein [Patescibacteria group bacterium]